VTRVRLPPPRVARWAVAAWTVFLLALTSWPSPPEIPGVTSIPNFDKFVHAVLYGTEGFLLYLAIGWPEPRRFSWLRALAVGGLLAVFGTLDELHQAWIPGRSMEAGDALADSLAGFAGALAASAALSRWGRKDVREPGAAAG
jgi:VanZ family protein